MSNNLMGTDFMPSDQTKLFADETVKTVYEIIQNNPNAKHFSTDQIIEMYRIGVEAQKADMLYSIQDKLSKLVDVLDNNTEEISGSLENISTSLDGIAKNIDVK